MSSIPEELHQLQQQAALDRKRGDALRKADRETEAVRAFEAAIAKLERALVVLDEVKWQNTPELAAQRAEVLGALGGLLRRLNRNDQAYGRYAEGATVEREFRLATTYNRVNEIKYSLLTGAATVAAVQDRARTTADVLSGMLTNPITQQLGDDGWAWADLGDCRGLSGELTEAGRAYTTFIAKAGVAAPATTLDILQRIADVLEKSQDADRSRVTATIETLHSQMGTRPSAGRR